MFPTIRDTPLSAARSSNRLEFVPSRRLGVAWLAWLMTAAALILFSQLPGWLAAILIVSVSGAGGFALWRYVFLRGARALRRLEWPGEEGTYHVALGLSGRRLAAMPEGCRRYTLHLWLLRFQTGEGPVQILVDTGRQDPKALRRLARRLFRDTDAAQGLVPAAGPRGTDTIRTKV